MNLFVLYICGVKFDLLLRKKSHSKVIGFWFYTDKRLDACTTFIFRNHLTSYSYNGATNKQYLRTKAVSLNLWRTKAFRGEAGKNLYVLLVFFFACKTISIVFRSTYIVSCVNQSNNGMKKKQKIENKCYYSCSSYSESYLLSGLPNFSIVTVQ